MVQHIQILRYISGMIPPLAAVALAAQLQAAPVIPEDWASEKPAPASTSAAIRDAVRGVLEEDRAKAGEVPRRHEVDTIRANVYERFGAEFREARVPDCLHPDGLKRQPPVIGFIGFGGWLAAPFVVLAKIRGKCN
jgi:hypothetical protein